MFPLTQHSLAGWHRLSPARLRPPVPWRVLAAMEVALTDAGRMQSAALADAGRVQSALIFLLMFETCMRPPEALALTRMHIIGRDAGRHRAQFRCDYTGRGVGQPSKTDEFDHTIALDMDRPTALGAWLTDHARKRPYASSTLWDFGYSKLQQDFSWTLGQLGASCFLTTLFCVRHGGASEDRSVRAHTLR